MGITFYNERGEFTAVLTGDAPVIDLTKELSTDPWIEGEWFGKPFYVLDGEAVPRPENPTTIDGLVLSNVPVPATVMIDKTSYETNVSTVELAFDYPGTHTVKVIAWPHLDKEFQVENPA